MKAQKEKTETLKIPQDLWQRMFDISMEISPDKKNLIKPLPILAIFCSRNSRHNIGSFKEKYEPRRTIWLERLL